MPGENKTGETQMMELLNYEDVAEKTGLSVQFLKKAKREMGLPHFKIGRLVKFSWPDVQNWIRSRQVAG